MAKHAKPTKLVISAMTRKRHTKPTGVEIAIEMPHDLAVKWAEFIGKYMVELQKTIQADLESKPAAAPEPQPVQKNDSNANLAQS